MDYPRSKVNDFVFSKRSLKNLKGVHPDLVKVVERALELTRQDFFVNEGRRTEERQRLLIAKGKSKTFHSRHLTGHAVDLIPYPPNGDIDEDEIYNINDWDQYYIIADAMKHASAELGIPLEWGGDWKSFLDGPHFQLPLKEYPK